MVSRERLNFSKFVPPGPGCRPTGFMQTVIKKKEEKTSLLKWQPMLRRKKKTKNWNVPKRKRKRKREPNLKRSMEGKACLLVHYCQSLTG